MAENLNPETVWYLKKMMELGEKSLAEGKIYSHEEVKALIKSRNNENRERDILYGGEYRDFSVYRFSYTRNQ